MLDLRGAKRLIYNGVSAKSLYHGNQLLWERPAPPPESNPAADIAAIVQRLGGTFTNFADAGKILATAGGAASAVGGPIHTAQPVTGPITASAPSDAARPVLREENGKRYCEIRPTGKGFALTPAQTHGYIMATMRVAVGFPALMCFVSQAPGTDNNNIRAHNHAPLNRWRVEVPNEYPFGTGGTVLKNGVATVDFTPGEWCVQEFGRGGRSDAIGALGFPTANGRDGCFDLAALVLLPDVPNAADLTALRDSMRQLSPQPIAT